MGGLFGLKSSVLMRLTSAGGKPVSAVDSNGAGTDSDESYRDSTGVVTVSMICPAAGPRVGGLFGLKSSGGAGTFRSASSAARAASRGGRGP